MKNIVIILVCLSLYSCRSAKIAPTIVNDSIPCEVTLKNQSEVLVMQQKKIKKEETKSTILYIVFSLLVAITGFELIK
jgi:hypothetical protein